MKTFTLRANVEFEAEDIDDALEKLSEHFQRVKEGEGSDLISKGDVRVRLAEKRDLPSGEVVTVKTEEDADAVNEAWLGPMKKLSELTGGVLRVRGYGHGDMSFDVWLEGEYIREVVYLPVGVVEKLIELSGK